MKQRRSKYTPGNFKLRVRRSNTGNGLFTEEDIPKGACIIEYTGRPVNEEDTARDDGKYFFDAGGGKTIDGNVRENIARYINHSCAPNCEADGPPGRVFILSLRPIKAGTELSYDYGKEYFDRHLKSKGCRCVACTRGILKTMAETRKGKKFLEVQSYAYKRGKKKVRVPRHDRSTPRTAKGKGK